MDPVPLMDFALDVMPIVMNIAMRLGVETRNPFYGELGGELCVLKATLMSPGSPDQLEQLLRRIPKLLNEIEKICTWPSRCVDGRYTTLRELEKTQSVMASKKVEQTVRKGLQAFAFEHERLRVEMITLIKRFSTVKGSRKSRKFLEPTSEAAMSSLKLPDEYPTFVNKHLYQALHTHLLCSCNSLNTERGKDRHCARLLLKLNHQLHETAAVQFDMLLSDLPATHSKHGDIRWLDTELIVSSKSVRKKHVRFSQHEKTSALHREKYRWLDPGQLCPLIRERSGSRLCLEIQGSEFRALEDGKPVEQTVMNGASVSLAEVLETRHLSNKMRGSLGYILARSLWQYYDSSWMNTEWSDEAIHFMHEPFPDAENISSLYACKPYLAIKFGEAGSRFAEFSDVAGKIHRFPRVLALGVMLLEIGIGNTLRNLIRPESSNVNTEWTTAKSVLANKKLWSIFHYPKYKKAIESCLNQELFASAPYSAEQTNEEYQNGLEQRKAIIHSSIVVPLEELFNGTGWSDELNHMEPISAAPPVVTAPEQQDAIISSSSIAALSVSKPSERPADRNDFKIAIVCALQHESSAVRAVFDRTWEPPTYGKAFNDPNAYTPGRIGDHNVVLAYLPGMGGPVTSALTAHFRHSYPSIGLVIVVGICGGAPEGENKKVISLGDVVISNSIVQYAYGSRYPDRLRRKDTLADSMSRPNHEIRSFLHMLGTIPERKNLLQRTQQSLEMLLEEEDYKEWKRPSQGINKLFNASYRHKHRKRGECETCDRCFQDRDEVCDYALKATCFELGCEESQSEHRSSTLPTVHFGTVASGDQVIKSGIDRDAIARQEQAIAFEMEGAGAWDNIPTIVIKGVCDFADSHKNKDWQNYASAVAACCMKALLTAWTPTDSLVPPARSA